MLSVLTTLIDRLEAKNICDTNVINWGSPVPSFGDLEKSEVATVGINPSNREFVDKMGKELRGTLRRFHTLRSLGIDSWSDVDFRHLRLIIDSCRSYFNGNPYDTWFRKLDQVVLGTNASYYDGSRKACHLDLIPYATATKWTNLTKNQRTSLLKITQDTLGLLIRESPIKVVILNGRSVVEQFQYISGLKLRKQLMSSWSLPRIKKTDIPGISYKGLLTKISDIGLGRNVLVLGYNHNIQSSFGVTKKVVISIRKWIKRSVEKEI